MPPKSTAKEQMRKILETYGGKTANKTSNLLLQDPELNELKPMTEFISRNWRDPLRPAMMKLASESVGGNPQETEQVAVAMSLINLSFYLWDDIIDKAPSRLFKPTLFGKFGEGSALIVGGLASAKAYTILNQIKLDQSKRERIGEMFWSMWAKIAMAETANLQAQKQGYSAKDKFLKIENEAAANLKTCLEIGAVIGNGTDNEIAHLGKYGQLVGVILELQNDVQVSLNLTLELSDKIRTGAYPYTMLRAIEQNSELQKILQETANSNTFGAKEIEKIVKGMLTTKTLEEIGKNIRKLTQQALKELEETKKNRAAMALRAFVETQPQLFKEILQR
jgi:geranylgeranyl pyrophosphate synthase